MIDLPVAVAGCGCPSDLNVGSVRPPRIEEPVKTTASAPARVPELRRAVREFLLVAALFLAYKAGRLAVADRVTDALGNADTLWHLEGRLHLPNEVALQQAVLSPDILVHLANGYYAYVHFPATAVCLLWMYLRHPDTYRWARTVFASLTGAALVVHVLLPLAPPRMLPAIGMVDTGMIYGPSVYGPPSTGTLTNQYAAMPSLHAGWALAVAVILITVTRSRWRWLWLAHPVLTSVVVVVTGNHYWLDIIIVVVLLAVVLVLVPYPRSLAAGPRRLAPGPRRIAPGPRRLVPGRLTSGRLATGRLGPRPRRLPPGQRRTPVPAPLRVTSKAVSDDAAPVLPHRSR
jgi:hypothetical protein